MQVEIVDAAFEGNDPAVEKVAGTDDLAAEVVDDETAPEGFDVQRRLVEMAGGVVAEVEHFKREFAAGDDEGPAARDPARVKVGGADEGELAFIGRIEWG